MSSAVQEKDYLEIGERLQVQQINIPNAGANIFSSSVPLGKSVRFIAYVLVTSQGATTGLEIDIVPQSGSNVVQVKGAFLPASSAGNFTLGNLDGKKPVFTLETGENLFMVGGPTVAMQASVWYWDSP